jgi:hypothetical protein
MTFSTESANAGRFPHKTILGKNLSISLLQGQNSGQNSRRIAALFDATGFWRALASDPFDRAEWLEAARVAPSIKSDFYTVLSSRDCLPEIESALDSDSNLRQCFRV